jgi:hypothetical protein
MRCVDTTLDVMEGWIIVALLRSEGIDAQLFNENFVRQNWFEMIGYGGFRVSASDGDAAQAREIITGYRRGDIALSNESDDFPPYPLCDSPSTDFVHERRRWPFLTYIATYALAVLCAVLDPLLELVYVFLVLPLLFLITVFPLMPGLSGRLINNRYRCRECASTWRESPMDFGEL